MKLLRATLTASSLMLMATAGTAFAGPMEFFQDVYQNLFGSSQFEQADSAFARDDYATAMRLWRPLAEQGDAHAQHKVGFMYELGLGVPKNEAEAAKWYRLSAEQSYANSQFQLAEMYRYGRGVPKNNVEAMKWYCRAAENGHYGAQNYLGSLPQLLEELCPK
jgi:TPR repeat protein